MVLPAPTDSKEAAVCSVHSDSRTCSSELHSCYSTSSDSFLSELEEEVGNCCNRTNSDCLQVNLQQNVHIQTDSEELEAGEDVTSRISCAENCDQAFASNVFPAKECEQSSIKSDRYTDFKTTKFPNNTASQPLTSDNVIVQPHSRCQNFTSDNGGYLSRRRQGITTFPGVANKAYFGKQSCSYTSEMEAVTHSRASGGKRYAEARSAASENQPNVVFCGHPLQTSPIHSSSFCLQKAIIPTTKTRSRSCPLPYSKLKKFTSLQNSSGPNPQPHASPNNSRKAHTNAQSSLKRNSTQQKTSDNKCWSKEPPGDDWGSRVVVSGLKGISATPRNKKLAKPNSFPAADSSVKSKTSSYVWKTQKGTVKDKEYFESLPKFMKRKTSTSTDKFIDNQGVIDIKLTSTKGLDAEYLETVNAGKNRNFFHDNFVCEPLVKPILINTRAISTDENSLNSFNTNDSLSFDNIDYEAKQSTIYQGNMKATEMLQLEDRESHASTVYSNQMSDGQDVNSASIQPYSVFLEPSLEPNLKEDNGNMSLHPMHESRNVKSESRMKVFPKASNVVRSSMPELGAKAFSLIQTCKNRRLSKLDQDETYVATNFPSKTNPKKGVGWKECKHGIWKSMSLLEGNKKNHPLFEKLSISCRRGKSTPESVKEVSNTAVDDGIVASLEMIKGNMSKGSQNTKYPSCKSKEVVANDLQDDITIRKLERVKTYTLLEKDCQKVLPSAKSSSTLDANSRTGLVENRSNAKLDAGMTKTYTTKMKAKKMLANLITSSPANVLKAELIREMIIRNWVMRRMQSGADYATATRGQQRIPDVCLDYVYRTQGCGDKGLMTYHRPVTPNLSAPRRLGSDEVTTCCGLGRRTKREQLQDDSREEKPVRLQSSDQRIKKEHLAVRMPRRVYSPPPPNPFTLAENYEPHVDLKPFKTENDIEETVPYRKVPRFLHTQKCEKTEGAPDEDYWGDWEEEPEGLGSATQIAIPLSTKYITAKDENENWPSPLPGKPAAPLTSTTHESQYTEEQKSESPPVKETSVVKTGTVCHCCNGGKESSLGFLCIAPPRRSLTEECLALVQSHRTNKEAQTTSLPQLGGCKPIFQTKIDAATTTDMLVYTVQINESTTMDHGLVDSETEDEGDIDDEAELLTSDGEGDLVETLSAETQTKPVVVLQVPLLRTELSGEPVRPALQDASTSTEVAEAFDVGTATSQMPCFEVGVDALQTVCVEAATVTQLDCVAAATETCFKIDATTEPPVACDLSRKENTDPSQIVVCSGRVPTPVCNSRYGQRVDPALKVVCSGRVCPPACVVEQNCRFTTLEHVCRLPHCSLPLSHCSSRSHSTSSSPRVSPIPEVRKVQNSRFSPETCDTSRFRKFVDMNSYAAAQVDRNIHVLNSPEGPGDGFALPNLYELQQNQGTFHSQYKMPQMVDFNSYPVQEKLRSPHLSPYPNDVEHHNTLTHHEITNSNSYSSHASQDNVCHCECPQCTALQDIYHSRPIFTKMSGNASVQTSVMPQNAMCNPSMYPSAKPMREMPCPLYQCWNESLVPSEEAPYRLAPHQWTQCYKHDQKVSQGCEIQRQLAATSPELKISDEIRTLENTLLVPLSYNGMTRNLCCKLCEEELRKFLEMRCQNNEIPVGENELRKKGVCQIYCTQQSDVSSHDRSRHKQQTEPYAKSPCYHRKQQTEPVVEKEQSLHKCCSLQGDKFVRRMEPIVQRTYTPPPSTNTALPQKKKYSQKHRASTAIRPAPTSHSLPEEAKSRPTGHYMSEQYSDSDADLSGSASEPALGRDFESNNGYEKNVCSSSPTASGKVFISTGTSCIWSNRIKGSHLSVRSGYLSPRNGRTTPCSGRTTPTSERTLTPIFEEVEPATAEEMQLARESSDQNILNWLQANRSQFSSNNGGHHTESSGYHHGYREETDQLSNQNRPNNCSIGQSFYRGLHTNSSSTTPTQIHRPNTNMDSSSCWVGRPCSSGGFDAAYCQCHQATSNNDNYPNTVNKMQCCIRSCMLGNTSENTARFDPSVSKTVPYSDAHLCFCSICKQIKDETCHPSFCSNVPVFGLNNCGGSNVFETTCRERDSPTRYLQAGGCSGHYGHSQDKKQQNTRSNYYSPPIPNNDFPEPVVEMESPFALGSEAHQQQNTVFRVTSHGLSKEAAQHPSSWLKHPKAVLASAILQPNPNLQLFKTRCLPSTCKCSKCLAKGANTHTPELLNTILQPPSPPTGCQSPENTHPITYVAQCTNDRNDQLLFSYQRNSTQPHVTPSPTPPSRLEHKTVQFRNEFVNFPHKLGHPKHPFTHHQAENNTQQLPEEIFVNDLSSHAAPRQGAESAIQQHQTDWCYGRSLPKYEQQNESNGPQVVCCMNSDPQKLGFFNGQLIPAAVDNTSCVEGSGLKQPHPLHQTCRVLNFDYGDIHANDASYKMANSELPPSDVCCRVCLLDSVPKKCEKDRITPESICIPCNVVNRTFAQCVDNNFCEICAPLIADRSMQNCCNSRASPTNYLNEYCCEGTNGNNGRLPPSTPKITNDNYTCYKTSPLTVDKLKCQKEQMDCFCCPCHLKSTAQQCSECVCCREEKHQNAEIQPQICEYCYEDQVVDGHYNQIILTCNKLPCSEGILLDEQCRGSLLKCPSNYKENEIGDSHGQCQMGYLQQMEHSTPSGHGKQKTMHLQHGEQGNVQMEDHCKIPCPRRLQHYLEQPYMDTQCRSNTNSEQKCTAHSGSVDPNTSGHVHSPARMQTINYYPCALKECTCRRFIPVAVKPLATRDCSEYVWKSLESKYSEQPFFNYHDVLQDDPQQLHPGIRSGTGNLITPDNASVGLNNGRTLINKYVENGYERPDGTEGGNKTHNDLKDHSVEYCLKPVAQNCAEAQTETGKTKTRYHICSPTCHVRTEEQQLQQLHKSDNATFVASASPKSNAHSTSPANQCMSWCQREPPLPVLYQRSSSPSGKLHRSFDIPSCPKQILQRSVGIWNIENGINSSNKETQNERTQEKTPTSTVGTSPSLSQYSELERIAEFPMCSPYEHSRAQIFQPIRDSRCTTITPFSDHSTSESSNQCNSVQHSLVSGEIEHCCPTASPTKCCLPCTIQQSAACCNSCRDNCACCLNTYSNFVPPRNSCVHGNCTGANTAPMCVDVLNCKQECSLGALKDQDTSVQQKSKTYALSPIKDQQSPTRRCSTASSWGRQALMETVGTQHWHDRQPEASTQATPNVVTTGTSNSGLFNAMQVSIGAAHSALATASPHPQVTPILPTWQQEYFRQQLSQGDNDVDEAATVCRQNSPRLSGSPTVNPTQSCAEAPCITASTGRHSACEATNVKHSGHERVVPRSPCRPGRKLLPQNIHIRRRTSPGIPSKYLMPSAYYRTLQPDGEQSSNVLSFTRVADLSAKHERQREVSVCPQF